MNVTCSLGIPYGAHPRQRLDVFLPERCAGAVTLVCIHGGGWQHGRPEDLRALCLHLAELGLASASVGYRLLVDGAKQGREMVDDVLAGTAKAVEEAALQGASADSAALLGSGHGSLLALAASAAGRAGGKEGPRLRAAVACGCLPTLAHWENCPTATARNLDHFAGTERDKLSPLELDPLRLPPTLILHGSEDKEVPLKVAQRLQQRQHEAHEPSVFALIEGAGHQFIEGAVDKAAKAAIERLLPFLAEYAREPEAERLFAGRCEQG